MVTDYNENANGGELAESNQLRMTTATTGPQSGGPQEGEIEEEETARFRCETCQRDFDTAIGLGVHRRSQHPREANDAIVVDRTNKQWNDEEMRLMASLEAQATIAGEKYMNQYLFGKVPNRKLGGIKGKRKTDEYKQMVLAEIDRLRTGSATNPISAQQPANTTPIDTQGIESIEDESNRRLTQRERIIKAINDSIAQVKKCNRVGAAELIILGNSAVRGEPLDGDRMARLVKQLVANTLVPKGPVLSRVTVYHGTRNQRRRQRYSAIQKMYKKDIGAAARMVLNENDLVATIVPEQEKMFDFWTQVFENGEEGETNGNIAVGEKPNMKPIWEPVTIAEIKQSRTSSEKAAGPDGISPSSWNKVNIHMKCLLYNLFILHEGVPKEIKLSRTVFLPKVDGGSEDPGEFRPLTICSVILREFNKILAKRLTTCHEYDERQTAYLPMDGVGINVSVLTSVIAETRRRRKELHLAILDLIKAFNSVYHTALMETIEEIGCPEGFKNYIKDMYNDVTTLLQFEGSSKLIKIKIGVYQGDPLSGPLFTLAYERALRALDGNVGFDMAPNTRINANAYSDDGVLMAMTVFGLQENINRFVDALAKIGLKINPRKSSTLSLVPSGRDKKMKVVSDKPFNVDGVPMNTLSITDFWKYLGVGYGCKGPTSVSTTMHAELKKLTEGPLKPQQRIRMLKSFVIPKFQDKLVLSRTTAAGLKKLDTKIKNNVRKWLHLPKDLPIAYIHAPVREGGLGVPCLQFWIPLMRLNRLRNIMKQGGERISAVLNCDLYKSIIYGSKQALSVLGKADPILNDYHTYWKTTLNGMVDGKDIRMASNHSSSTVINSIRMDELRSEDYIHYNQIRSNSIPTRKRVARGRRRKPTTCRAGCRQVETLQHVVQMCERTHYGRILRHDRVVDLLHDGLVQQGYVGNKEKVFRTSQEIHKPDLIMLKNNTAYVVDIQIVKCNDLENDHVLKVRKYSEAGELEGLIKAKYRVENVKYEACTISYKGIWSKKSADSLMELGVTRYCMFMIVTSVLRGTWLNWRQFNKVTMMYR